MHTVCWHLSLCVPLPLPAKYPTKPLHNRALLPVGLHNAALSCVGKHVASSLILRNSKAKRVLSQLSPTVRRMFEGHWAHP